jgi:hypothetical protein
MQQDVNKHLPLTNQLHDTKAQVACTDVKVYPSAKWRSEGVKT